jgi:hypothetical protein
MPRIFRAGVLRELGRVAEHVIVVDYAAEMPWNFSGIRNRILEISAGSEHFANFRDFRMEGGLHSLVNDANLSIQSSKLIDSRNLLVLHLQKTKE